MSAGVSEYFLEFPSTPIGIETFSGTLQDLVFSLNNDQKRFGLFP